jgi:hypothetical protein
MSETYTVVLLVEQALTAADAAQVHSLHEELDADVHYHVLLPIEDAAARIEAALGTIGGDAMVSPAAPVSRRWRPRGRSPRSSRMPTWPAPSRP